MPFSFLSHLECSRCGATHDASVAQNVCACGAPLLARYDLDGVRQGVSLARFAARAPVLWRYHELLPVTSSHAVVSLGEGMTPLIPLPRLGKEIGLPRLVLKDEATIPTGTFKARGAAVGVARARELGITRIAMPTNGNAGAAWATYAARAGMRALIVMPEDAPLTTRAECAVTGAELYLVRGLIGDAGRLVSAAVERDGWFDAATLREPYRIEGKKTMGLELVEQLGWRLPDAIVYPTGGGVGLIGIHKALRELRDLGWLTGAPPRLVAVQSSGCAPIVEAFERGERQTEPWPAAQTVAFGLTVPKPLGDFMVLDAVRESEGCAVAVDDADLLSEQRYCAEAEGVFVCPEGAAALRAVRRLRESGWLGEDDEVVVLNTGAGSKYPDVVASMPPVLDPDDPDPLFNRTTGRSHWAAVAG